MKPEPDPSLKNQAQPTSNRSMWRKFTVLPIYIYGFIHSLININVAKPPFLTSYHGMGRYIHVQPLCAI
jgi:hypothetical protein